MTAQRRRDAIKAVQLADGTYLIRSGCCRPMQCAPAAGIRCCLGARCECDWPEGPLRGPAAPMTERLNARVTGRGFGIAVATGSAIATLALCGGIAWFVVANFERILFAGGALLLLALGLGLWAGRPGGGHTTNITVNNK